METFKNKTAIIIGGTSGIGEATSNQLLSQGAEVHVVGRSPEKIADREHLTKHQVDITNSEDLNRFIASIGDLDNIDFLVNASGIFGPKPFLETMAR